MQKARILSLLLSIATISGPLLAQRNNAEFRATWVITWEHISSSSTVDQNKARVRQILDNHQAARMNAVLWQVRQSGTAYYNSSYEPWGYYAGYSNPGYDPLAYAIEEAHKRGMEIHAWFNVFQASSTIAGAPAAEHPDWICRDRDGIPMSSNICLSPGLKAVRDYTLQVAMEIVRNYDIDGLHLDYIRWNEYSNSKTSKSLARRAEEEQWLDGMVTDEIIEDLEKNKAGRYLYDIEHPYSAGVPQGFSTWEEWWRWSVTEFVRCLHDSIQAVKPWVRLSVAALGKYNWSSWQGYGSVYQDAALWFNQGFIDQLTPMHYHWTTGSGFVSMLTGTTEAWGPFIQQGLRDGRLFSVGPGSYILEENNVWYRHPEIVNACRTVPWVDGFQFFSYGTWKNNAYFPEAGQTFFAKKTKIRATGLIDNTPPPAPLLSIQKIDSLHYQLTITPPKNAENHWLALYRSEDNQIDPNSDALVALQFGQTPVTITEVFDGKQDFNDRYTYGATLLDRFWNESTVSNAVLTDEIPSFPPTVVSHTPSQGATVPVTSGIVITFSKTINPATFLANFSITPQQTIGTTIWSNGNKTVTITFANPLPFNTDFLVTIGAELADINGKRLDGNGDGIGGDAYQFSFKTFALDLAGPRILTSYPDLTTTNFDVDDVINLIFDEIIKPASLTTETVQLKTDVYPLSTEALLTRLGNQSVLSIRPYAKFLSNADNYLTVKATLTDTLNNQMESDFNLDFHTANNYYTDMVMLDDFTGLGSWWQPSGSGSTVGIISADCIFGYTTTTFVPGTTFDATKKKGAYLKYKWDTSTSPNLIREHIGTSTPTSIKIDTSYTIQCYVFGDGSGTLFNFSLYEKDASGNNTSDIIEVGTWQPIDWIGWKLVEWDLGDPSQVGDFISANRNMNGNHYILDGLLLKKTPTSAVSGQIFIDDLRLIKRANGPAPANNPPQLTALPDTSVTSGKYIIIRPTYIDPDPTDQHQIICQSDTSGIFFKIMGHTSGSIVYVKTLADYVGIGTVTVIVKDYGIGELADTVTFKLNVLPASGIVEAPTVNQFHLSQNYPNPFNPVTNISFYLPKSTVVQLVIHNLRGEHVTTLVNEQLAAGYYHYTFDASKLPSGEYLYSLITSEGRLTRKMLILK